MNDRHWHHLSYGLLAGVLLVILATFLSYGLTWDERVQMEYGENIFKWYLSGFTDYSAMTHKDLYLYGGFFEILAQLSTRVLPFGLYEDRHLINSICGFIGVVTAYRLGSHLAGGMGGFLSGLFLALTPLYYGHLFNNPKDIPFAVAMLLFMHFVIRSWDELPRVSAGSIIRLGALLGVTLAIRIGGIMAMGYLTLLWVSWLAGSIVLSWPVKTGTLVATAGRILGSLAAITVIAWVVMVAFWPWAQLAPLTNPLRALQESTAFQYSRTVFFGGEFIPANRLPAGYLPTWFAISLPEFYILAILTGAATVWGQMRSWRGKPEQLEPVAKVGLLVVCCSVPIVMALAMRPVLYDSQRHFIFIVPFMAILAGVSVARFMRSGIRAPVKAGMAVLVSISVIVSAVDMVELHPYQYVYFNRLIGGGIEAASQRFETDYWGQSYKEGVEWVVQNYRPGSPDKIRVANCSEAFLTDYYFAKSEKLSERFATKTPRDQSDLFLSTTRWECQKTVQGEVLHVVERKGVPLLYVIEGRQVRTDRRHSTQ